MATEVAQLVAGAGIDRLDAEVLLAAALGRDRAWLIAHREQSVEPETAAAFAAGVQRRLAGEPLAYILGYKEFFSLRIRVTPDTLIPRPETELVVELALQRLPPEEPREVLDLATGSGCIALAIAHERPLVQVTGSDVSAAAVAVARVSARELNLTNVRFVLGSWYRPVAGRRFDLITANPPYVDPDDPALRQPELTHEPQLALTAGTDPLSAYRRIFEGASAHLHEGGALIVEHGHDQDQHLTGLLAESGLEPVAAHRDLAGHPRVLVARPKLNDSGPAMI